MAHWESSLSVFELLWNVAVSLLVLRIAFFYYGLTFFTGCVFGSIRLGVLVPMYHFRQPIAELIEMPFMLMAIAFWARFTVTKYEVPKVAWLRLTIGLLGLVFMVTTEVVMKRMLSGQSSTESKSKIDILARVAFGISLVIFGLMPWLVMVSSDDKIIWEDESFSQGIMHLSHAR
jgi:hypothetical protein